MPDAAAALFVFMGWLTRRKEVSGPFSGSQGADQAATLVGEFCEWNHLPEAVVESCGYTHPEPGPAHDSPQSDETETGD